MISFSSSAGVKFYDGLTRRRHHGGLGDFHLDVLATAAFTDVMRPLKDELAQSSEETRRLQEPYAA